MIGRIGATYNAIAKCCAYWGKFPSPAASSSGNGKFRNMKHQARGMYADSLSAAREQVHQTTQFYCIWGNLIFVMDFDDIYENYKEML